MSVAPFTQEKTHKSRSHRAPIFRRGWFTQSETDPPYRRSTVNSHWKPALWLFCEGGSPVSPCQFDSLTRRTEAVFLRKFHLSPLRWLFFITNTQWVQVFCRWRTLFFGQKCDEESVGQAGGRMLVHVYLRYFFPHKSPKTVTVTTLLLFGHVTLLCGTFLCNKDPCS